MKKLYFLMAIVLISHPIYAQLYINEFMASNNHTIADEFGEFDDWIEIYNHYEHAVDLSAFYLTDNLSNPTKWSFPAISIAAKGYLLIWADDSKAQGAFHANFKLNAEGEQIGLYNGKNFIDCLAFGQQTTDISYGRFPDGGTNWVSFSKPTPNAPNSDSIIKIAEVPQFSVKGGFYSLPVTVELTVTSPNASIYYTVDCYEPTKKSTLYTGPILIDKPTIIRARTYEDGYLPSDIKTHTYWFNTDFKIPVMSLVTDPPNLWDPAIGIYMNPEKTGDDWERPVSIEFYEENNKSGFSENGGIRIHGMNSRLFDKKPFRIYFKNDYGQSWLNYQIFPIKSHINKYKRLVLHTGSKDMPNSDEPEFWTLLRDALASELSRITGGIFAARRNTALFLNGEPWGIYIVSERIDEYYIESNFGETDFDLIEKELTGYIARAGDLIEWSKTLSFFENSDLTINSNYETAKTLIDLANFTDYHILEIYVDNIHFPLCDIFAFRPRREGSVWRWILWDVDRSLAWRTIHRNTLEFAISEDAKEGNLILRKLLQNEDYKNLFINRFNDLLNTAFSPLRVNQIIDSLAAQIRSDISFETNKWGSSPALWEDNIENRLHYFANYRPDIVRDHIKQQFSLNGTAKLTIDPPINGQGSVKVNTIFISNYPWEGVYFQEIPITLTAIPNPGFRFAGWSDPSLPQTEEISINLGDDYTIHARFEVDTPVNVVITEINYNSDRNFNCEDWIELYNPSDEPVNISGWHLKDNDAAHDFIFPQGTRLSAKGCLVICRNQSLFHSLFPNVTGYIGNFNFGLSRDGDQVRIFSSSHILIDSVSYDNESPWPTEPDGTGSTLELIHPDLDNTLATNWQASLKYGSPGQLTRALPVVTSFFVTDSSGSTELTDSRDILIAMTDSDYDGNIIKWHINENGMQPSLAEFQLTSRPNSYHIKAPVGDVTLYAWVLDNDNQVNRLTNNSKATIRLVLNEARFIITGTINYGSKKQSVSDVIMTLYNPEGVASDTTDATGNYLVSAIKAGAVTLKLTKLNDTQDAITGSDAIFVLQYLPFFVDMSNDNKFAADVTEDGKVTDSDVLAILRYLAFYADNIGSTGQWRFQPRDTSFTLNADVTIDFKTYLLGDVNLSWIASAPPTALYSNISLEIEPAVVHQDEYIEIPMRLVTDDETMNTLQFSVEYDAECLRFHSLKQTPASESFLIEANAIETGKVHVAMAGTNGITSTTEILRFRFKVIAPLLNEQGTKLTLTRALANDRIIKTTPSSAVRFTEAKPETPLDDFALFHNYPNPFNSETQIEFHLPHSAHVTIMIYNLRGSEIRTILNENKPAGSYRITWDGKDHQGKVMPSGIYVLQLKSAGFVQSKKMIMMK